MSACHRFEDDLALLAGDDLGVRGNVDAWELRAHLAGCDACTQAFASLQDLVAATRAAAPSLPQPTGSVLTGVLAHLSAEAREVPAPAPRTRVGATHGTLPLVGKAAAAVLLAACTGLLGLQLMRHEPGSPTQGAAPDADQPTRNVAVHRTDGGALELSWDSDGREAASAVKPYRVLASASPVDFSAARPVEVAGSRVVASMPLPAQRRPDRTITYFRVE